MDFDLIAAHGIRWGQEAGTVLGGSFFAANGFVAGSRCLKNIGFLLVLHRPSLRLEQKGLLTFLCSSDPATVPHALNLETT